MSPIVKCLAMALTLLAVGGCAYRDALVLETARKSTELNTVATEVRTGALKAVGLKPMGSRRKALL